MATAAAREETTPVISTYAWYVVGVLTLCYTLSYIDRQILGTFVGPVRETFGISDAQFGLLQGFGFAVFYTLVGLPLGRVVDQTSRRNLIVAGIVVWSFFTAWCATAGSFEMLFIGRVGVGVGEATLGPAAMSMLADIFPVTRLGLATSIFYIGNLLGASLALIIGGAVREAVAGALVTVPLLGPMEGWRIVFLMLGIPGLIFALLVFTIKEPARRGLLRGAGGEVSRPSIAETVAEIRLRWQSVAGISLAFACQAACNYGFSAWAVEYFLRVHHWQPGETTRALGFLIVTCGIGGLYTGGWLADRWQKRGITDATLRIAIPSSLGILIFFPAAMLVGSPVLCLTLVAPALFAIALPMGTAGASFQNIFPNQIRGQVSALYLFILNIGGLPVGNYIPGLLTTDVFRDGQMLGVAVALTIGVCGTLMFVLITLTRRPYRRHFAMMHPPK